MAESRGRQGRDRGGRRPGPERGKHGAEGRGPGGPWGKRGVVQRGCPVQGPSEEAEGTVQEQLQTGHQGEAGAARNVGETRSLGSVTDRCQSGDKCRPSSARYCAAIEGCGAQAGTGPEARKLAGGTSGQLEGLPPTPRPQISPTSTTKVSPQHQGVNGPGPETAAKPRSHLSTTQREAEAWKDPSPPPPGPPGHWASS